jgi:RNA polymerase sigma factor (sigma-70 family)
MKDVHGRGESMAAWGADARYTRMVEEHGEKLLHLAIMLTGNRHDGEDVLQDVLIAAASAWPIAQPLAYLKRSVVNRSIDLGRKRRDVLTDTVPERAVDDLGFLLHEQHREFFAMVQQLPTRQRDAIVLRYYADYDDATTARLLGISIQTVRSQIHHALAKLRVTEPLRRGRETS